MKTFLKSIKITLAFCVLLSVCYIFILWAVAKAAGPNGGEAEVVAVGEQVVGAANVGQAFANTNYFWGRPSAVDYNGGGSGGSNKGTTNPEYLAVVEDRIESFLDAHPYLSPSDVPSEMVTASGSGLDPNISPNGAFVQVQRVAQARDIEEGIVYELVKRHIEQPWLGMFGTAKVNVLKLNVALDAIRPLTNVKSVSMNGDAVQMPGGNDQKN